MAMDERNDLEGEHKEEEQWNTVQDEALERNWEENWSGGTYLNTPINRGRDSASEHRWR